MAEVVRRRAGGIWGLLEELDRHGEAIEYDLILAGWTLDDVPGRLSWRSLAAFVRQGAQQRGTALNRTLVGADHAWGLVEQLQAAAVDALNVANWQRASQGKKKAKKPKPIPRPGVGPKTRKAGGTTKLKLSEARKIFEARNPAAFGIQVWQPPTCKEDGCGNEIHARQMCPKHYQRWRRAKQ